MNLTVFDESFVVPVCDERTEFFLIKLIKPVDGSFSSSKTADSSGFSVKFSHDGNDSSIAVNSSVSSIRIGCTRLTTDVVIIYKDKKDKK
jgi:hypothetical protein